MLDESQLFPSGKRPVYGLTKSSGTLLIQQIAKDVTPDKLQIISFHPGLIYNAEWKRMGIKDTDLPFDDCEFPLMLQLKLEADVTLQRNSLGHFPYGPRLARRRFCMGGLCGRLGISMNTLRERIERGWRRVWII